jgi:hypothetical protein
MTPMRCWEQPYHTLSRLANECSRDSELVGEGTNGAADEAAGVAHEATENAAHESVDAVDEAADAAPEAAGAAGSISGPTR